MKHRLLILTTIVLSALQLLAQGIRYDDDPVDLESLYQQIDNAILQSPRYVAERERQITACSDSLVQAVTPEQRLPLAERLFQLYIPFRNDSAVYYADQCISLAESLRRPDLAGRYRAQLAYQCSNADMSAEAVELLRLVDRSALDKKGLVDYYNAWMHVYGELASYSQRESVRQTYFDRQNLYRDSVMMVAYEGSEEWYHLKVDILSAMRQFQEALRISNQWQKRVKDGTHESAYAAFYRSVVYDHLNNQEMAHYWLAKSALDDIRCAVMNQASLLFLANHLADDGDLDRAQRYMDFARVCNFRFLPRLRAYQVDPVVNIVEKSRNAASDRLSTVLVASAVVILLLVLALLFVLLRKRKP